MYSIIPVEIIFKEPYEKSDNTFIEVDYLGERVEVTADTAGNYKINRIISTSPKAYLNPELQPGTIISKKLVP